jgi:hypothetical protein
MRCSQPLCFTYRPSSNHRFVVHMHLLELFCNTCQLSTPAQVAIKQMQLLQQTAPRADPRRETPEEVFMREVCTTIQISRECAHVVQCFGWSKAKDGQLCLIMRRYKQTMSELIGDDYCKSPVCTLYGCVDV